MAFDVEGAKSAGYSDAEIADHLAEQSKFDAAGARKSGYSDQEIISHLAGAGHPAEKPTVGQSVARGLGLGVRDVIQGVAGPLYDTAAIPFRAAGFPVNSLAENLTALGLPESTTPGERMISAVTEPVASTLTGQGVGRMMAGAASPVAQAVGNALTQQPVIQAASAGLGGAVGEATGSPLAGLAASAAAPLVAAGAGAVGRALSGASGGASVPDAALGKLARDKYAIPITAPDMSDNSLYRISTNQLGKLPFSGAGAADAAKREAWQSAIAAEMGQPAKAFTPDVMNAAKSRIGQAFDDVAARTSIPPAQTATLASDLAPIIPLAERNLGPQELIPLRKEIDHITGLIAKNNGTLSGEAYQALTRSKAPLDLAESSANPNVAHYAGLIRDAVDDAFVRSASPADQAALTEAKYQYRIMRTIDPLVAGSRDGRISPDAFMQKVLTASRKFDSPTGGMAYTGGGNIGELARIGKLMREPPQTGSADRALINFATLGLAGGGAATLNPVMAATVPAALAANRASGAYLRSGFLANRLIESSMNPPPVRPNALLTSGVVAGEDRLRQLERR